VSVPIEAPPERPGHVGHTPQGFINLGMRLGRFYELGGIFGSGVVRALTGGPQSAGVLGADLTVDYAMQPFGIPGRTDDRAKPPTPAAAAASTAHTLLALEEARIKFGRGGNRQSVPQALQDALDEFRTWRAPR
jgi:hypothetical protein